MTTDAITRIPFGRLVESDTNPRKVFAAGAMAELVESIKSQGVLQPIVVRPLVQQLQGLASDDDEPERFQVVFGHRRFRAAQEAELGEMPCIVRAMTDSEVAQAQLHENLSRADVHPIEEAEAYQALMQQHGVSADQLVQQTGKSRSYIYGRLALLKACQAVRTACLAGEIGSETALLIARLRTDRLQQQALNAISGRGYSLTDGGKRSFRSIRNLLREKFTLALYGKDCLFDPDDVFLVEDAGPCSTCPKRSGNAPEFEDIATPGQATRLGHKPGDTDLCTDPDCYDKKKRAHLAQRATALEASGKTVLAGAAARAAVSATSQVKGAYIPITEARAALKALPKKSLAGRVEPEVITIQDPRTGKTHEAMRRADLERTGITLDKPDDNGRSSHRRDEAARHSKATEMDVENRARRAVLDQVRARAAEQRRSLLELQLVARQAFRMTGWGVERDLLKLWGADSTDAMDDRISAMSPDELGLLLLDCAILEDIEATTWNIDNSAENLFAIARHYDIDIDAARRAATVAPASTPSTAARAPEGEEEPAPGASAAAGAEADDDTDDGDLASADEDPPGEESRMVEAGSAGNADQMVEAGSAGQLVSAAAWPFPKRREGSHHGA